MVEYKCDKCNKNFKQKSGWIDHLNKKYPCGRNNDIKLCNENIQNVNTDLQINISSTKITPSSTKITPNSTKIPPNSTKFINNTSKITINYDLCCKYCLKIFSRKDVLKKHVLNRCKIKKELDNEKEIIFKKLLEKDEQIETLIKQNNTVIDQINILKKQNDELLKQNKKSNQNITITNNYIQIFQFGKEDLKQIDDEYYFKLIKNYSSTGSKIFIDIIKYIHFNPIYPQFHNVYISDINRDKCMLYKNNKWILEKFENIYPEFISKMIEFGYSKEEVMQNFFEKGKLNKAGLEVIKNGMRWIRLIDENAEHYEYDNNNDNNDNDNNDNNHNNNEYISELKIDDSINSMIVFRNKHNKDNLEKRIKNNLKNHLYNNKDLVIENFNKLNKDMNNILIF